VDISNLQAGPAPVAGMRRSYGGGSRTTSAIWHICAPPLVKAVLLLAGAAILRAVPKLPTAPLAAGSLIAGYAVASASGSRSLGGVVLAAGGLWCLREWARRNDARTAATLGVAGLVAFAGSHVLAKAVGAWPAVLLVATAMGALTWAFADARTRPLATS
jgi:hypothetical protein